jgi:hypothetical protein
MRKMLVLLVVSACLVAACGGDDDDDATSTTTETTTESTVANASETRQAALISAVDLDERTLTYDEIEFLTGDEAIERYRADNPDDPAGVPENDYLIVNDDTALLTAPIAEDVTVGLTHHLGVDLHPSSVDELPSYESLTELPFWLTINGGEITEIEEQYIP